MSIKEINISWIVVSDLEKAVSYYNEVLGLKILKHIKEMGWAELQGEEGGPVLGLAQANDKEQVKAGTNAVVALRVDDMNDAIEKYTKKGVQFAGDVLEVPGHVKLQTFHDADGNMFQLIEELS